MFESYEDLIEQSVNLNHQSIPFLITLAKLVTDMHPKPQPFTHDLQEYINEVLAFMSKIEASSTEDGELFADDFEDRKIH